jgi:hypothetical protein
MPLHLAGKKKIAPGGRNDRFTQHDFLRVHQPRVNWNIFKAAAAGPGAVVDLHFVPLVPINSICGNSARGVRKPEFCLNFRSQKFLTSHIRDGIGHLPLKIYPTDLNEYSSFSASRIVFAAGCKTGRRR